VPDDLLPTPAAGPAPPADAAAGARGATQAAAGPAVAAAAQAPPGGGGGGGDGVDAGVALLMRSYEDELKQPLRSALGGQLARSLLIQARPAAGRWALASGPCAAHPRPWARTRTRGFRGAARGAHGAKFPPL
jgi:hypothetical protein